MIEQTILAKLDEILERLDNLDKLAERRERDRLRNQIVRGRVRGLKENEEGKEKNPPDPLKEKGEEEKESTHTLHARAHGKGSSTLQPVIDVHKPPTLEELLIWTKSRGYSDEKFIREWFNKMTNELYWCHPTTGNPLNHWPAFFGKCYRQRNLLKVEANPRTPTNRHADNWRGTKKEDIGDVLG